MPLLSYSALKNVDLQTILLQVAGIHGSVHLLELLYFSIKATMKVWVGTCTLSLWHIPQSLFTPILCSIHHSCVQWCHMSWVSNSCL